MILKRYGTSYHSVQPNFNPTAMTEIGFMRDREFSISADGFADRYKLVSTEELGAEADADVQRDAERALLANLEASLGELVGKLDGRVLVVENGREDWPKTRERRESVIVDGENRFYFHWWVEPPLKMGVYAAG